MDKEKLFTYYQHTERLLTIMTDMDGFKVEDINTELSGLCRLFRISKGITEFYSSLEHERSHKGEVLICYDDGRKCHEVLSKRIVTKAMTVVKATVYMADGEEPLSDEERKKVQLLMKTVLSFVARNRLQNIVERLTFYDDNGYRNMRSFMRYIQQLNDKDKLGGNTAVHFNLRHFTLINQEIGRNAGDVVIHNYFTMLEDIIGNQGIVCRIGGDNFVAIFDDSLLTDVLMVLQGVPVVYDANNSKRIMVSASTGVFLIPEGFKLECPGDIMDKIITSSQEARTGGSDNIIFFDDDMVIGKEKVSRIQQVFPEALENGEFKVFYQPKIDIETGNIIGAEALCRWERDGQLVPPMEFIPVLEQSTDICKLDFYMLDHVCKDIRRWLSEKRPVVRVSVNLSRKHMMDVDLLEHILRVIDSNNVPHQYIEIELTETTTDVEFRDLKRVVSGLQQAGICTSVDDFGMGYSSLNLIREIPWNVLKVDRSFLPADDSNSHSSKNIMFKYVIAMAKELGVECIAEGVETRNQVDVLRGNQCMLAQGFYFDKPLPLADFEKRLDSKHYDIDEE
ncbi:MAG: EAL domain-containing protein [Ruminococcus sp.]|nr:EAL domain-containing protein [Ruminococcus sp.]